MLAARGGEEQRQQHDRGEVGDRRGRDGGLTQLATSTWPASLSTGTTRPSDVADRVMATSSGRHEPSRRVNPTPAADAQRQRESGSRARRAAATGRAAGRTSISSPARNSRNASPNSARICTGRSTCTQPSTDGPSTIPAMISRTTAGSRSSGAKPTTSGASTATSADDEQVGERHVRHAVRHQVGLEQSRSQTSLTVGNDGTACQSVSSGTSPAIATVAECSSSCTPGPVNVAPTMTPARLVDDELAGAARRRCPACRRRRRRRSVRDDRATPRPRSRASASVRPTAQTCGSVNVTRGTTSARDLVDARPGPG